MARIKQGKGKLSATRKPSDPGFSWPTSDSAPSTSRKASTKEKVGELANGDLEDEIPPKNVDETKSYEEEEDSDEDEDGVDEEGMARLMKALGDDTLNDFDRAQLSALDDEEEDEDKEEDDNEEELGVEAAQVDSGNMSDEESESEGEAEVEGADDQQEEEEEEQEVALEDIEDIVDEDAVPKQKLEIDNQVALKRIRETFQLDSSLPWTETLVLSYPETIDVDVNDDLNRELAFYKQALHSANAARTLAAKHSFPFTRPADYFAEMVKTDAHMERIRQRLLDESASIKKSEDKRKEREGKKFGKQVQLEKMKEREREKKGMEERLKGLKRKRKDVLDGAAGKAGAGEEFDIAVEDAISDRPAKRSKQGGGKDGISRKARDSKYGFGGARKRSKQNTRDSTDDFVPRRGGGKGGRGGFGGGGGGRGGGRGGKAGGGSQRPGKSKRMAARSRR